MIKILLVDDHKIVRDGIRALLMGEPDIIIVGECSDGSEVIRFLNKNEVDIVLMDIKMSKINGVEATRKVVKKFPEIGVIALTMHDEEFLLSKMVNAGACGCVLKTDGKEELLKAIKSVALNGGTYFSHQVNLIMQSSGIIKGDGGSEITDYEDLTRRELEVIKLIAEENTNNEIAAKLCISPRTVDTHRRNLLYKLGVRNTAGLVKFAINQGLTDN